MEDQEKGYEVKDKRRINPDGTIKEETAEPEPESKTETQEGEHEHGNFELPYMDVYTTLQLTIGMLVEKAWEFMGVRLPSGSKEMKKDMVQAKLAIDTIVFLVDKLQPNFSEDDRKTMKALVSDLQINFIHHN